MKLVPAIILALTLATGAHAVDNKLPRGNFCQLMTIGVGVYEPLPESDPQKARDRCGDRVLIFTPGGYEVLEAGCKYISVKIWYDPSISTETKSPTALRGAWVSLRSQNAAVRVARGVRRRLCMKPRATSFLGPGTSEKRNVRANAPRQRAAE